MAELKPLQQLIPEYKWTNEEKVITFQELHIPALHSISHREYFFRAPVYPLHHHGNHIEFHCMIKGQRMNTVQRDETNLRYLQNGNQVFVTQPYEIHQTGELVQTRHELYGFQINLSDPYHLMGLDRQMSYELYQAMTALDQHLYQADNCIQYLKDAFSMFATLEPAKIHLGTSLLNCFLFSMVGARAVEKTDSQAIDPAINRVLKYITENCREDLPLEKLAKLSGYSLSHFKVRFKAEIGITPAEYISLKRIALAKEILFHSHKDITEIAAELGYSSSSYFSQVFKKYTSFTPKEYRQLH